MDDLMPEPPFSAFPRRRPAPSPPPKGGGRCPFAPSPRDTARGARRCAGRAARGAGSRGPASPGPGAKECGRQAPLPLIPVVPPIIQNVPRCRIPPAENGPKVMSLGALGGGGVPPPHAVNVWELEARRRAPGAPHPGRAKKTRRARTTERAYEATYVRTGKADRRGR